MANRIVGVVFLALGLLLTVPLKLVKDPWARFDAGDDEFALMIRMVSGAGLDVVKVGTFSNYLPHVVGRRQNCELKLFGISPLGEHRSMIFSMAGASDRVLFLYDRSLFSDQPVWTTRFNYYVSKVLSIGNLGVPFRPVFGAIASRSCDTEKMDFWGHR